MVSRVLFSPAVLIVGAVALAGVLILVFVLHMVRAVRGDKSDTSDKKLIKPLVTENDFSSACVDEEDV